MAIQNATKKTMKEYLNSNYYIPSNQRDYTWEEDQLADFWDDLKSVVGLNEARHFFGQIVIYCETDNKKGKSKNMSLMDSSALLLLCSFCEPFNMWQINSLKR